MPSESARFNQGDTVNWCSKAKYECRAIFVWLNLGLTVLVSILLLESALALDITLTWDPSSIPVDGYKAFCRQEGEDYDYAQPAWKGSNRTCTVYDLDDQTAHYFVVRAYNKLGESGNSNEACSEESDTEIGPAVEAGGCFIASAVQKLSSTQNAHPNAAR